MEKYVLPQKINSDFKFPASHLLLQLLTQAQLSHHNASPCRPTHARSERTWRFFAVSFVNASAGGRTGYREFRSWPARPRGSRRGLTFSAKSNVTTRRFITDCPSAEIDSLKVYFRISNKRAVNLKSKFKNGGVTYFSIWTSKLFPQLKVDYSSINSFLNFSSSSRYQ